MEYRKLGSTGLEASVIGMGCEGMCEENYGMAKRLFDAAEELGITLQTGEVHSSDVFYSGPNAETWQSIRERTSVDCVEMESFALFHNANVLGKRAACLLTISDSFISHVELTAEERQNSFRTMMTLALESAIRL